MAQDPAQAPPNASPPADKAPHRPETRSFLCFTWREDFFAIDIRYVRELLDTPLVVAVPGAPKFIMGVINYSGEILSITNMFPFFGLPDSPETEHYKVIVLNKLPIVTGLIVGFSAKFTLKHFNLLLRKGTT